MDKRDGRVECGRWPRWPAPTGSKEGRGGEDAAWSHSELCASRQTHQSSLELFDTSLVKLRTVFSTKIFILAHGALPRATSELIKINILT